MTKAQETSILIKEIISKMVSKPEAVDVGHQTSEDGNVYFPARVAPEDEAVLIGAGGSHVRAIEFLVACFGLHFGAWTWTFRAVTPSRAGRARRDFPVDAIRYDPTPILALLQRVVAASGVEGTTCRVRPGNGARVGLSYLFEIEAPTAALYASLTGTPIHLAEFFPGKSRLTEIGTIFRSMGKNAGVRFNVAATRQLVGPAS